MTRSPRYLPSPPQQKARVQQGTLIISIDVALFRLYPCHTIAYDTSVCQRMNKISHMLVHADKW